MDYEDTKIDKKGNCYCYIFVGLLLYFIVSISIKYIIGETNISELFWTIVLVTPFLAVGIIIPYINIKNSKKNREIVEIIKEKGTKVKGTIKKIKKEYNYDYNNSLFKKASFFRRKKSFFPGGVGSYDEYYESAIVEYEYKGETKIINTPYLSFHKEDLTSKDVDVFIYDDKVYVDNYKIKREEIKRKYKNRKNMKIKVVISFIILFILISLFIFLTIVGLIPIKYIPFIIGGLIFVYYISASIIYLKYLDEEFNKNNHSSVGKSDEI